MRQFLALLLAATPLLSAEKPIPQDWDYAAPMKKVAAKGQGRSGVVLHIGDSITYANPYSQWARGGEGRNDEDKAALKWMNAGKDDDSDGWYLARVDLPEGRSHTACSGLRLNELLAGGRADMTSLEKLLDKFKPQAVVLMIGTNDASARRETADFRKDYIVAIDKMLERGIVPIVSTIPPHIQQPKVAKFFNDEIREIAKDKGLPLIDYEKEILTRRPDDWNGTLMNKGDVHPSGASAGTNPNGAPTAENLKNSGYLLRGWLSVQKIKEVKTSVFDGLEKPKAKPPEKPLPPAKPAPGKPIRLPITRDTWLSNVGGESDTSNGGAGRLKLKSYQEMSLFDIDASGLKGQQIVSATLHVKLAGPERLGRVTIGTVGAEWVEGKGSNYATEPGASTFKHRKHPDVPWAVAGSDLCSVILGAGGTIWGNADATAPDADGWQTIAIDPRVLRARIAGVSYGFLMFDDTGTEWTRDGEKFELKPFPNRFVHSRESGDNAPYVTVDIGEPDEIAPGVVSDLATSTVGLPAGEALVSWSTPRDQQGHVAGFLVQENGADVPRYLIPAPGSVGKPVTMHLRDLAFKPGQEVAVSIRAVDGAGNIGAAASVQFPVSAHESKPLPGTAPSTPAEAGPLPTIAGASVMIVDELDKLDAVTGEMIPPQPEAYLAANHLWSAKDRRVRLFAARGEILAFQIAFKGALADLKPSLSLPPTAKVTTTFGRYAHVRAGKAFLPDPIVPIDDGFSIPTPNEGIEGQKFGSIHAELLIANDAAAGDHEGTLKLQVGKDTLTLNITLRVWDFTLPDRLSFLPEMNSYGLPQGERGYYRVAHRHRTIMNVVPYNQRGEVTPGWGPGWNGSLLDTLRWDRRFGPYFDGTAFDDLPRKGVPLECFYLPLHENWPTPVAGHYDGTYWADKAFDDTHRRNFVSASRQFAEHVAERGWTETMFQCYLNNKVDFKRHGWSRASAPWSLDEPASFQDFWALRYFAKTFHQGVSAAAGKGNVVFRGDISRPMWQRDSLDALLDYNVMNIDWRRYKRLVLDRQRAHNDIVIEYGSANDIAKSNLQAVAWSLDAWSYGADGIVPWNTIGSNNAWKLSEPTSLFYPPRRLGESDPTPSIRLKAYLRGQQDVEYLTLLSQATDEPRWSVGQRVRERLKLAGQKEATGAAGEDAGVLTYDRLRPQDVWSLRVQVGEELSKLKPAAKDRLVEFRTPRRAPAD